ncbi:hypothetical protein KQI58_17530 [Enterococcus raffinosus]|nr:hypothetical protein [Enterococcus raffinosus]
MSDRTKNHPYFQKEFGHLEGNTIVGVHHKNAVITLVERQSKATITLNPEGRKAKNIESSLSNWLQTISKNLLRLIVEKNFLTGK